MAEPTLTEVFGAGASQTSTTITIAKSDLAAVGLTAAASNTAESLLSALILKAGEFLTQDAFNADTSGETSISINGGFDSIITTPAGVQVRQKQRIVNFHQPDAAATIVPDDY